MAPHQENCDICIRIEQIKAGHHPGFIAELETGYAVLGDSQYFPGYSLLLCKTPATELSQLTLPVRLKFLEEMALLAQAVENVVQPHKLNYECLGNQVHHLHWHIFPRNTYEPCPNMPVWTCMPPAEEGAKYALDPARDADLIRALATELKRLTAKA